MGFSSFHPVLLLASTRLPGIYGSNAETDSGPCSVPVWDMQSSRSIIAMLFFNQRCAKLWHPSRCSCLLFAVASAFLGLACFNFPLIAGLANKNGIGSVLQAVLETATGLSMRLEWEGIAAACCSQWLGRALTASFPKLRAFPMKARIRTPVVSCHLDEATAANAPGVACVSLLRGVPSAGSTVKYGKGRFACYWHGSRRRNSRQHCERNRWPLRSGCTYGFIHVDFHRYMLLT